MKRDVAALAEREFDVIVIGGGSYGVCLAWEAARRGLSVAIVERGDFGHATSANSFKMVHGGIRYLQHGDLARLRASVRERNFFLRAAPHLVHPLPIAIPTYGHGRSGKSLLRAGVAAYDVLAWDRNRSVRDPSRRVPAGRAIGRDECLSLFPGLNDKGLTGAVLFSDAQMHNPPRLALAILKEAVADGAVAANYVRAVGFLRRNNRIIGIEAEDEIGGDRFRIWSRTVINAAGPWAERLLAETLDLSVSPPSTFSRDAYLVIDRRSTAGCGLAVQGRTRDPDAVVSRSARHLFVVPWRDVTLVGVWHVVYDGAPDRLSLGQDDVTTFIDEVNEAQPGLAIAVGDVIGQHCGSVLFGTNETGARDLSYGKRSRIIDHGHTHGLEGLITVVGVRWTTARAVAERVMGQVAARQGRGTAAPPNHATPCVAGGDIDDIETMIRDAVIRRPAGSTEAAMRELVRNHGSRHPEVLGVVAENAEWGEPLEGTDTLAAEVVYSAQHEMAQSLSDVVFRRTGLGTAKRPPEEALCQAAAAMSLALGWNATRRMDELDAVRSRLDAMRLEPAWIS